MDYFYCPPEKIAGNSVLIEGEEFSHLVHVMRKKAGDVIRVVDGEGTAYEVVLGELKKKQARGRITATHVNHNEPSVGVTLAVGILKNPSRFDFLVEKVTELGVKEIIPMKTERTIPSHAKVERWQKLALAAMKQCGRGYLPRVRELTSLEEILRDSGKFDLKFVAHEQEASAASLPKLVSGRHKSILMLIGPEGGFGTREIELCEANGFVPVSLGVRRLRTETAAIHVAVQMLR